MLENNTETVEAVGAETRSAEAKSREGRGGGSMIVGARRPSTATMLAARHSAWGSPLEVAEVDRPEPMAGEVRIRVGATSVNPIDMHTGRNAG